ncbi:MAG TPA: hypothetical protein VGI81_23590 [Tepidisphaeraceae bacterium]|jgi:hypothetical protein
MTIVFPCAAGKDPGAGCLQTAAGQHVRFVAHPELAPAARDYDASFVYAHPDDFPPDSERPTWREQLRAYNSESNGNPLGLLRASQLYTHPVYRQLAASIPERGLFILSAGWGLVNAGYRLPHYDITFCKEAESHKRRYHRDPFADWCHLDRSTSGPIVFFALGGYDKLFRKLTASLCWETIVVHGSAHAPKGPSWWRTRYFDWQREMQAPNQRTWHYDCASKILSGEISI